ncbi:hypothetical protein FIBSPDRAFT_885703 [Athelia psychrophila]|uniref:Uncharacterized protein n=1 Tax=Athelia psychrophila TaxID=1759441 RepID=A0A166RMY3_9AGAM|nr:hypothetical protein FIBSPDRAFT_885703 [Fibularhizoctonia sp. CBS 109695]
MEDERNRDWSGLQWTDAYGHEYMKGGFPALTTLSADQHLDNSYQALTKAAFNSVDTTMIEYSRTSLLKSYCLASRPVQRLAISRNNLRCSHQYVTPTESATLEFKLSVPFQCFYLADIEDRWVASDSGALDTIRESTVNQQESVALVPIFACSEFEIHLVGNAAPDKMIPGVHAASIEALGGGISAKARKCWPLEKEMKTAIKCTAAQDRKLVN